MNGFKKIITICVSTMVMFSASNSFAASGLTGCAAKKEEIMTQITAAKAHGNAHRAAGLNTALQEVDAHCSDDSLLRERQEKVSEKLHKVAERAEELKNAQDDGRSDKIAKKQAKLDIAKQELAEAQAELTK